MKLSDFQLGQEVFVEDRHARSGQPLLARTVTKLGRKYIELDNGRQRFEPVRMVIDDSYSNSRVWLSREAYDESRLRHRLWREFYLKVNGFNPPEHVTIDGIRKAAELLGLVIE